MNTPSFKEDHISQIPALQFLQNMGYIYLSPDEALKQRGNKTTAVLLEDILRSQLKKINTFDYKGNKFDFSDNNIQSGIQALKDIPMQEGFMSAAEYVYNFLTLGKAFEQSVDGDKKSYTLQYIDWDEPEKNIYHVTEEFSVMRATSKEHYRPDLVLFINGIPICIIECKRPDIKEPLKQAISQHLRNQLEDGIRNLYVYSQIILSVATTRAAFGTTGTEEKYWAKWEERFSNTSAEDKYREILNNLKNKRLSKEQKEKMFAERFRYVRHYFDSLEKENILSTSQDEYLYSLCEPMRMLDLIFNFIVFEDGVKKIARYQQFFALKKTMARLETIENGKRTGGVIWHTQGSGKSLTMVMLAQAIAIKIKNPKIILVTDRVDLDKQLTGTFRKCKRIVDNASTGSKLLELLKNKSDAIVTTVINKFVSALKYSTRTFDSPNIFVLVDECHRTQYGSFNRQMRKVLPNACFIAMTGTPLMKKEKNTAMKFGGIIDKYSIKKAVADEAVVRLLYEGRHAFQKVNENPIDSYFQKISETLTKQQKADLKKKFSRAEQLNKADQKIYAIAWDISIHFRDNWQNTGFKAQLACQSKNAAIKYHNYFKEIGIVSSEIVISPPDDREGQEDVYEKRSGLVHTFWDRMMNEHGSAKKYEENIIARFKYQGEPEIIIVVDKLLTGFDAPKNTVLYITRSLHDHTLLQAIARVNRVCTGKDFGYLIDYYGVLFELDSALQKYSEFEDYDSEDLLGVFTNINEEVKSLPQKYSELWDIFKTIANKKDAESFEVLLKDEALRAIFYNKLTDYLKCFKIALSTDRFYEETSEKTINQYKNDADFFRNLRFSVTQRYSDTIDFSQYEAQIQKLIDRHILSDQVVSITDLVDIFDEEKFKAELEKTEGTAAKADKIASRTAKHITEKMEEDPVFYKKFSDMLKETIRDYEEHRINEVEYLNRTDHFMESVLSHTGQDIPSELEPHDVAKAFYGLTVEALNDKIDDNLVRKTIAVQTALSIDDIIIRRAFENNNPVIDWTDKSNITGKILIEIGDYLIDEVKSKYDLKLSFDEIDDLSDKLLQVAKIRYK